MATGSACDKHDSRLADIMGEEGNQIPAFFNAVFGFLYRQCPEKIYSSSQISGEHLINQSFCKWRERYLQDKLLNAKIDCEPPFPVAAEEVVISQNTEIVRTDPKSFPCMENQSQNSPPSVSSKVTRTNSSVNTGNGTTRDSYGWSQTIDDLEVRVSVPSNVKKGKQVKVKLQASSMEVSYQDLTSWKTLVSGDLAYSIKSEESIWSLVPGEHVLINLEKKDERWWDRLLAGEDPIDLQKLDAERDFSTLPQEEQEKIRELVWNKQQQDQGKPTSDKFKMESMLREAWDAEGSPFKGQTYNPSMINFAGNFGPG